MNNKEEVNKITLNGSVHLKKKLRQGYTANAYGAVLKLFTSKID